MIWIAVILLPLALALLLPLPGVGRGARLLVPLAPVPALWLALAGPADGGATFEPLVLGLRLGFGEAGRIFLLFTAMLWLAAGIFARGYLRDDPRRGRFHGFHLVTMAGNFGLILARDVPAFYSFFAMMTFAAYGLVIHTGTPAALRAARIYLITAVAGEALLLGAIFLAVGAADSVRLVDIGPAVAASPQRDLIVALAFFGFGVKAGALPVHFWLPLAHPVAPVPASAVLSGAMIKAGLLGWLHFLPLGHGAFPGWSLFCIGLGLAAAFGAVVAGAVQNDPKTILAYSSISQMGVMTVVLGIGLASPAIWQAALPVLLLHALNHALAKGALFLGAGVALASGRDARLRRFVIALLAVPALVIAGAPWTGGSAVKYAVQDLTVGLPEHARVALGWLLPLTAIGTPLLLGRFLWLTAWKSRAKPHRSATPLMWVSWLVVAAGTWVGVAWAAAFYSLEIAATPPGPATLWKNTWPILAGLALLLGLGRFFTGKRKPPPIPAGDIVVLLERVAHGLRHIPLRMPLPGPSAWKLNFVEPLERLAASERRSDFANRLEERLRHRSVPGLLFLLLALALIAFLTFGTPLS